MKKLLILMTMAVLLSGAAGCRICDWVMVVKGSYKIAERIFLVFSVALVGTDGSLNVLRA